MSGYLPSNTDPDTLDRLLDELTSDFSAPPEWSGASRWLEARSGRTLFSDAARKMRSIEHGLSPRWIVEEKYNPRPSLQDQLRWQIAQYQRQRLLDRVLWATIIVLAAVSLVVTLAVVSSLIGGG